MSNPVQNAIVKEVLQLIDTRPNFDAPAPFDNGDLRDLAPQVTSRVEEFHTEFAKGHCG